MNMRRNINIADAINPATEITSLARSLRSTVPLLIPKNYQLWRSRYLADRPSQIGINVGRERLIEQTQRWLASGGSERYFTG